MRATANRKPYVPSTYFPSMLRLRFRPRKTAIMTPCCAVFKGLDWSSTKEKTMAPKLEPQLELLLTQLCVSHTAVPLASFVLAFLHCRMTDAGSPAVSRLNEKGQWGEQRLVGFEAASWAPGRRTLMIRLDSSVFRFLLEMLSTSAVKCARMELSEMILSRKRLYRVRLMKFGKGSKRSHLFSSYRIFDVWYIDAITIGVQKQSTRLQFTGDHCVWWLFADSFLMSHARAFSSPFPSRERLRVNRAPAFSERHRAPCILQKIPGIVWRPSMSDREER